MLGADAVMGADQPGLHVAEDGMDDREELGGIGAGALDDRGVLEMSGQCRLAPLVPHEAVGQQV